MQVYLIQLTDGEGKRMSDVIPFQNSQITQFSQLKVVICKGSVVTPGDFIMTLK
jgi:hypothetical protein